MTGKTIHRATLATYAALLGKKSNTAALLREYDSAKVKPNIIVSDSKLRLESRNASLASGHVVAIRGNFGLDRRMCVTITKITEVNGFPAISFKSSGGLASWCYQSSIISVIYPVTP